jgi:hypothetical protein
MFYSHESKLRPAMESFISIPSILVRDNILLQELTV